MGKLKPETFLVCPVPNPADARFIDDDWDASEGFCLWDGTELSCDDGSTPDDSV